MSLLSAIGGLVGLAFGGPMGAALGSGIGTLASGGDIGDALKSGLLGYGIGSIPGVAGLASQGASAMGMQGLAGQFAAKQASQQALMSKALPGMFGSGAGSGALGAGVKAGAGMAPAAQASVGQGLFSSPMAQNLVLAGLIQAGEPKPEPLTPEQKYTAQTGERTPYRGTATRDMRPGFRNQMRTNRAGIGSMNMAQGGYIQGPGTGKSDSIPAAIYQNGGRVQEARLSDGEFVMTEQAVRGLGNGNRAAGAAKMYEMMNRFERMA